MSSTLGFNIPSTNNKINRTNHNKENKASNIQKERELQTFIKLHLFSLIRLNGLTLQCIPNGVVICRDLVDDGDGNAKEKLKKIVKRKRCSRHHSLLRKTWKTKKRIRKGLRTRDELGSRLRMGKVLAPHSACPKIIPLIK